MTPASSSNDRGRTSPGPPGDRALVDQARLGTAGAFAALVRRWQGPLFNFLLQHTGNHDDAADLTQEAFLRAWRRLDLYDSRWSFSTWLFSVAHRLWLDHVRRQRRWRRSEQRATPRRAAPDPGVAAGVDDEARRLWALAGEVLSAEQRSALWLRYALDRPVDELAAVYGKSRVGVRVMLFRARQRLLAEHDRAQPVHRPGPARERALGSTAMTTEVA